MTNSVQSRAKSYTFSRLTGGGAKVISWAPGARSIHECLAIREFGVCNLYCKTIIPIKHVEYELYNHHIHQVS
jgi:hypothetical protein